MTNSRVIYQLEIDIDDTFEAMHYNMLNLNVLCGILGIDAS